MTGNLMASSAANADRDSKQTLVLGVDGGGTKTTAWLARVDGEGLTLIGKAKCGPSNLVAMDFSDAMQNVAAAIYTAMGDADVPVQTVDVACLCLAGAGRESERQSAIAWCQAHSIAGTVSVVGDAEMLLFADDNLNAAIDDSPSGICLIAGTGSLAWGRNSEGETARAGGWGYVLGDQGGAYAVSLECLRETCKTADQFGPNDPLVTALLNHLQLSAPQDLVAWCHANRDARRLIASLCPFWFDLQQSAPNIRVCIDEGASDLARQVQAVANQLGLVECGFDLTVAGSVIIGQPEYRDAIINRLAMHIAGPISLRQPQYPVSGAVRLAARQLSQQR